MLSLLQSKTKEFRQSILLSPNIADRHIGLRSHLGDGVFLMENGDLGSMFSIAEIADEPLTEQQLYRAVTPLQSFASELIKGIPSSYADSSTVIQIICSQRACEYGTKDRSDRTINQAGEIVTGEEAYLFKGGLAERNFYLCIRWTPKRRATSDFWRAYPLKEDLERFKTVFLREIKNKSIETQLSLVSLSTEQVLSYLNSIFLRGNKPHFTLGEEDIASLHENIVNPQCSGSKDGFDFKDGNIRLFTFSEFPTKFALGRIRHFMGQLPLKSFELVWTLSHGYDRCGTGHIVKKMFFSQGPSFLKIFNDLNKFEFDINNQNSAGLFSLRLIAYDVDEELEAKIISASVRVTGIPMIRESEIGTHLIATSLPMNCPSFAHRIPGRCRTVLLDRAISFAPLYSASHDEGAKRIWSSREGLPSGFDIFNTGGNNHLCILGNSESGKSCLMAQFLLEFMWRFEDGIIRVIDKKTSYGKLADLFKGKVIAFSESFLKENPYSPFSYETWDEDDVLLTVVFIQNALEKVNPGVKLSGLHTELLSDAVKMCAQEHEKNKTRPKDLETDPHFTWVDIQKKLPIAAEAKDTNRDLAKRALDELRALSVSFDKGGQFSFLFCAHEKQNSRTDGTPLVVYDLDGISDPRLQVIAAQLAFLKIARDLKKLNREKRKLIVFEELGILVRGDSQESSEIATRFMRNIVKTARKIGAQAVGITNELSDFKETDGGRAFWQISTQKLFLPQSESEKENIKALEGELSLADIEIICDLEIRKGFYSQGYLISKPTEFRGSFLIPLSPAMNTIVTTSAKEEAYYQSLRKSGLTVEEALDKMTKDHPYGREL